MSPPVSQVSRIDQNPAADSCAACSSSAVFLVIAMLVAEPVHELKRLATGVLASTAVVGLIIGFAAQHTIANMVAGVQIAVSQPIRIGDRISFEEIDGRVTDITLSYTYVDPGDGSSRRDPQPAAGRRDRPQPLDRRHQGLSAAPAAKYPCSR